MKIPKNLSIIASTVLAAVVALSSAVSLYSLFYKAPEPVLIDKPSFPEQPQYSQSLEPELTEQVLTSLRTRNELIDIIDEYYDAHKKPASKNYTRMDSTELLTLLTEKTRKYDLDLISTLAQMSVESDFFLEAVSIADCKGLMQLSEGALGVYNYHNETDYKWSEITNPEINVEVGCWYMSYLRDTHDKSGDSGLYCYNAGPFGRPGIPEAVNYVKNINARTSEINLRVAMASYDVGSSTLRPDLSTRVACSF